MREKAGRKFSADSAFSWPDSAFSRDFLAPFFSLIMKASLPSICPERPSWAPLTADWHLRPY